jgi:hypothetical protein
MAHVNEMLNGLGLALVSAVAAGVGLKVLIGLVLR